VRPTLHTVAERAGVSTATVSRFLNGSPRVSQETAAKIRHAIDELGYLPNASARGLVLSSTGTLALIFPGLSGPFFSELIRGAEAGARETGYHLLIYAASSMMETSQDPSLGLLATKIDGLILASEDIDLGYIEDVQRRGVPVVVLGRTPEGIPADSIRPDNTGGAHQAVSHLIEHGYRRIAMVAGPDTRLHAGDRAKGYRKALDDHGLPYEPGRVVTGDFSEASGYAAMLQLLRQAPAPDAVFAANDEMAIGALAAAHASGVRVPADIAVAAFDDIEPARYMQPPLTTVQQDMHGQGRMAVRMLLARVNGSDAAVETKLIPTQLVIRQSCGCTGLPRSKAPVIMNRAGPV
jgi:LacI family transcriptional regulator